jgi:hypothetical protein
MMPFYAEIAMNTLASESVRAAPVNDTEDEMLSEDDIFHVLQNQRRRLVLRYLEGRDDAVRMGDVAEQVAAWEHDTTVQALNSTQRQRVYIPLYQNHLPKLDEKGIIEYNQSRGIVERTPIADQLEAYLDPFEYGSGDSETDDEEFPWEIPYVGVAGIGTLLVVGKAWNLPVFSMTPDVLLGALILVLFTATSAVQLASERAFTS